MNDQDQETAAIAKTLELLDKGEKMEDILPFIPHGYEENVREYAELVNWIEAERDTIAVPPASLEKILAAIEIPESSAKEIRTDKAVADTGKSGRSVHIPLSELIPAKPKVSHARIVENIPVQKKALAPSPDSKLALSWNAFFGKDSLLGASISLQSWKVWAPASLVAIILIFVGLNGGSVPQGKPEVVALSAPAQSAATAVPNVSAPIAASVPASAPKTASLMKTAAIPVAQPAAPSSSSSPSDQYAALYSSSDSEASAANTTDSDLAAANTAPADAASNSYDENTI